MNDTIGSAAQREVEHTPMPFPSPQPSEPKCIYQLTYHNKSHVLLKLQLKLV